MFSDPQNPFLVSFDFISIVLMLKTAFADLLIDWMCPSSFATVGPRWTALTAANDVWGRCAVLGAFTGTGRFHGAIWP